MAPEVGLERGFLCCPNTYKDQSSFHSNEIKLTPHLLRGCTEPARTGTSTDSFTDTLHPRRVLGDGCETIREFGNLLHKKP